MTKNNKLTDHHLKHGWGLIRPPSLDEAILKALEELLFHRKKGAAPHYREYIYHFPESAYDFVARNGGRLGPPDRRQIPEYLLILGDPTEIPFDFQQDLSTWHCVGRLCFPSPEQYYYYANALVHVERRGPLPDTTMEFFAPRNVGDDATRMTCDHLVYPIIKKIEEAWSPGDAMLVQRLEAEATKAQLLADLREVQPSLLFIASHGVELRADDPRQPEIQGAFVCQDWPGRGAVFTEDPLYYVAGSDLTADLDLRGLAIFAFTCHSGGTPEFDTYDLQRRGEPLRIAGRPAVARFAQKVLSLPNGAALGMIGRLGRGLTRSFIWRNAYDQTLFERVIRGLSRGCTTGFVLREFLLRYLLLSAELGRLFERRLLGQEHPTTEMGEAWKAVRDAGNYILLGDPAARLSTDLLGPGPNEGAD